MNMVTALASPIRHILLFEPRVEGHHLTWLRMYIQDFLSAGCQVTVALNGEKTARDRWQDSLAEDLPHVACLPIEAVDGKFTPAVAAQALSGSGAEDLFMGAMDEFSSVVLRRAAFGWRPPQALQGRWSGVCHRPRFLGPGWSPNHWLKRLGFVRLLRQRWFGRVFVVDEFLCADAHRRWPGSPLYYLPTPCMTTFSTPKDQARQRLGVPPDRFVFLFYGGGYRRKGLHLVVAAMQQMPPGSRGFLLCAGQQPQDAQLRARLEVLVQRGQAAILDRYVSLAEEELCFSASDVVLLPYIHHFGTSAVLSQAVQAGKPIVASDEELSGKRVRENGLGWLFPSNQVPGLRQCLEAALAASPAILEQYRQAARTFAATCTRESFRTALLQAYGWPRTQY